MHSAINLKMLSQIGSPASPRLIQIYLKPKKEVPSPLESTSRL